MNEAFIQNAEHDVDRHQRGQHQQRFIRERVAERRRRALKIGLDAGRHIQVLLHFLHGGDGIAQSAIFRQIERDRHRRKLALVGDRERLGWRFEMSESAERHRVVVGGGGGGVGRRAGVRCADAGSDRGCRRSQRSRGRRIRQRRRWSRSIPPKTIRMRRKMTRPLPRSAPTTRSPGCTSCAACPGRAGIAGSTSRIT